MSLASNNVIAELRHKMFERMIRLPSSYYSDNLSGRSHYRELLTTLVASLALQPLR